MPPANQTVQLKVCDCVQPHPAGKWRAGLNDLAGPGKAWVCLNDGGPISYTADLDCPRCDGKGLMPDRATDIRATLEASRAALADFARWGHAMSPAETTNALSGLLLSQVAILEAISERLSQLEARNYGDGK